MMGKGSRGGESMPVQIPIYSSIITLNFGGFCGLHDGPKNARGLEHTLAPEDTSIIFITERLLY